MDNVSFAVIGLSPTRAFVSEAVTAPAGGTTEGAWRLGEVPAILRQPIGQAGNPNTAPRNVTATPTRTAAPRPAATRVTARPAVAGGECHA